MSGADDQRMRDFLRLFTSHEIRLRAFAMSLIPNWADAEDVLQQASLILWQKFGQFAPGSDFFAWSARVVYLQAKDHRKRQLRAKIRFGDEFFDAVAREAETLSHELDERQRLLGDCIGRLRDKQREVLRMRYQEGRSAGSISQAMGCSVDAIYNSLTRIRKALIDCVNRKLRIEEAHET